MTARACLVACPNTIWLLLLGKADFTLNQPPRVRAIALLSLFNVVVSPELVSSKMTLNDYSAKGIFYSHIVQKQHKRVDSKDDSLSNTNILLCPFYFLGILSWHFIVVVVFLSVGRFSLSYPTGE